MASTRALSSCPIDPIATAAAAAAAVAASAIGAAASAPSPAECPLPTLARPVEGVVRAPVVHIGRAMIAESENRALGEARLAWCEAAPLPAAIRRALIPAGVGGEGERVDTTVVQGECVAGCSWRKTISYHSRGGGGRADMWACSRLRSPS